MSSKAYDPDEPALWRVTIEGPTRPDGTYVQQRILISDLLAQQTVLRVETGDKDRDDLFVVNKLAGFELERR